MKRLILCWIILLTLGVALVAEGGSNSMLKLTDPLASPETKALYRRDDPVSADHTLTGQHAVFDGVV